MKKDIIFGIEFLKFLAAVMITNSHFKILYPDSLSALGTFGAPGNALFFFVSGFTLMLGWKNLSFFDWYKRRYYRIWPSVVAWLTIINPILFDECFIHTKYFWIGGYFWFLNCILVYYAIYWFIGRYLKKHLLHIFFISLIIETVSFFFMPVCSTSIYATDFHYICFFSSMILGAWISYNKELIISKNWKRELLFCLASFLLFYAIQAVGKGKIGILYYLQIFSIIPLHIFLYYIYVLSIKDWTRYFMCNLALSKIPRTIASLTLEIYLVNFVCIVTDYNNLFPINLAVVSLGIMALAYLTRIVSNFILQTLQINEYKWKDIFTLF